MAVNTWFGERGGLRVFAQSVHEDEGHVDGEASVIATGRQPHYIPMNKHNTSCRGDTTTNVKNET